MPVVLRSKIWRRYMPTLRFFPSALFVNTRGRVTNLPPSCGQHLSTGISERSMSLPCLTTSWQGAEPLARFGIMRVSGRAFFASSKKSCIERGGVVFTSSSISAPASSRLLSPRAIAMRLELPKRFVATGKLCFSPSHTFSNRRALPPSGFFDSSSVIFEISISGDTFSVWRVSSPAASSAAINS